MERGPQAAVAAVARPVVKAVTAAAEEVPVGKVVPVAEKEVRAHAEPAVNFLTPQDYEDLFSVIEWGRV